MFRLNNPGLYAAAKALKELRSLIHYCLADGVPGRHKINKTKTRLADIHQKARDKHLGSTHIRLINDIQQLLALVEDTFKELRDHDPEIPQEIIRFLAIYLSLLDALGEAAAKSLLRSGEAASGAGRLITDGRKLLRSSRAAILSGTDNPTGSMALLTLYSHFETWLSTTGKFSRNFYIIPEDSGMGGRSALVSPKDKMDEDFDEDFKELIEEAAALKKEFLAAAHYSWYRYSPHHPGYTLWKQNVLALIKHSAGEQSLYYTNLVETEKAYSKSMPASVFSAFLNTLNKARHAPRTVSPVVYNTSLVPPPPPRSNSVCSPLICVAAAC